MRWAARGLTFFAGATLTYAGFLDFCNLVYQCGCRSAWAGADAACNVHRAGVRHCPWCVHPEAYHLVLAVAMAVQLGLNLAPWRWPIRLLATLAAFPFAGGLLAAAYGLLDGYW